jgi:hypothetical protein
VAAAVVVVVVAAAAAVMGLVRACLNSVVSHIRRQRSAAAAAAVVVGSVGVPVCACVWTARPDKPRAWFFCRWHLGRQPAAVVAAAAAAAAVVGLMGGCACVTVCRVAVCGGTINRMLRPAVVSPGDRPAGGRRPAALCACRRATARRPDVRVPAAGWPPPCACAASRGGASARRCRGASAHQGGRPPGRAGPGGIGGVPPSAVPPRKLLAGARAAAPLPGPGAASGAARRQQGAGAGGAYWTFPARASVRRARTARSPAFGGRRRKSQAQVRLGRSGFAGQTRIVLIAQSARARGGPATALQLSLRPAAASSVPAGAPRRVRRPNFKLHRRAQPAQRPRWPPHPPSGLHCAHNRCNEGNDSDE